ncbi:MAG: glycoside hydrolase family 172 protein [bacterium]
MDQSIDLGFMPFLSDAQTFALTAENPSGEKGKGGQTASEQLGPTRKGSPCITIPAQSTAILADIKGAGCIKHIWFGLPLPKVDYEPGHNILRDMVIRMYWDDEETPSVEAPIGDFFALGQGTPAPLVSQMVTIAEGRALNCFWSMPFATSARIEIENQHTEEQPMVFYQIDGERYDCLDPKAARFHAQWRRENPTTLKKDYTLLEAKGRGHYVGTVLSLCPLRTQWWGEGEVKVYLDGDKEFPTLCGTGIEDYFLSSYGIGEWCSPYHGCPLYRGGRVSMYRWHVVDPIRFMKEIRITVQNIGYHETLAERSDDMDSTAFWYQVEPHAAFPKFPDILSRRPQEPTILDYKP